jgi:hypothetical protein
MLTSLRKSCFLHENALRVGSAVWTAAWIVHYTTFRTPFTQTLPRLWLLMLSLAQATLLFSISSLPRKAFDSGSHGTSQHYYF